MARVPSVEIITALKYRIASELSQKMMYPIPAPTAENKKFFLLDTVIKDIANGQLPPTTDEKLSTKDNASQISLPAISFIICLYELLIFNFSLTCIVNPFTLTPFITNHYYI